MGATSPQLAPCSPLKLLACQETPVGMGATSTQLLPFTPLKLLVRQ